MLIKITYVCHHTDDPANYPVFYGHLLEDNTIFYDGLVWTLQSMPFVSDADAYLMTSISPGLNGLPEATSMLVVYEAA